MMLQWNIRLACETMCHAGDLVGIDRFIIQCQ